MLTAYLTFNGNAEEAINFYKSAFNGTITNLQRLGDMPPQGGQLPESEKNKIMHIALEGPGGVKLMASDFFGMSGEKFTAGNNFSLSLHPDSQDQADKLFNSLSAGGSVIMPMSKAPWGDYFGMFNDKFGIKWMINHQAK
jgi:PhnB protein